MLLDLLSSSNYVSYNIKLAELLGLHSAIYLSEIMSINEKAVRKNKLEENCIRIVRPYVTSRTTIDEKEQKDIEKNLIKLGILSPTKDVDTVSLNLTTLTSLMMSTDEKLIDDIKKITKRKKKTKAECIRDEVKANITVENEELRLAYDGWIDAVFTKYQWMSNACVTVAMREVDEYSNHDLDKALKVIEVASIHGYREMKWAIKKIEEESVPTGYRPNVIQNIVTKSTELSSEVF